MDVRPLIAILLASTAPAEAAPFVAGDPRPLSVLIAASRATVVVRPAVENDRRVGWRIDSVLHDVTGKVERGRIIAPRPAPPPDATLALLISNADSTVTPLSLSDEAARYVVVLPRPDAPAEERLQFALEHFDHADPVIADDAFAELARFTGADLARHRHLLLLDRLRKVIDDPNATGDRLGLAGYLLGLCGDGDDARRLKRRFLTADPVNGGAAGLAAGYLLLAGERGLAELETCLFTRDEVSPLLVAAVFEAFVFFRTERPETFRPDRLRRAACCAFLRPDAADLAVGHLVAARDWAALPEVTSLLTAEDPQADRRRAAQVAAVRFLEECRRDGDAPAAIRAAADRTLSQVAENDPDLVRRATILSGGPPDRR